MGCYTIKSYRRFESFPSPLISGAKTRRQVNSEMSTIVRSLEVNGKSIVIEGNFLRIGRLEHEWFEDLEDPQQLINSLQKIQHSPDILTFWQRLPDVQPKHSYTMRPDAIAALPIRSYSIWWEKQLHASARNKLRKAQKKGIVVTPASFDDEFVRGMTTIFNETPVRQGRHFLHYGK